MADLGGDAATRTAKVLSLPTRAAILALLLRSGSKTVKEIADHFHIHPNVARAHLDLMVEAGFLATDTRRQEKGRPAKVYFTWEGEAGALSEAGVEVELDRRVVETVDEIGFEVRVLERMLNDAANQLTRVKELIEQKKRAQKPKEEVPEQ